MYKLRAESSFDSAHFLSGYDGKCKNIHGHRWRVIVEIQGSSLIDAGSERGMLLDFGELKKALKEETEYFDHALIYESESLRKETVDALAGEGMRLICVDYRPTAENIAQYFYQKLKSEGFSIKEVTVYETPGNCAVYTEENL